MGVGAAEAEGVDPGAGGPLVVGPGDGPGGDLVRQGGRVDGGVEVLQVDVGRDGPVLEAQDGLDQPGDPGGGFGVPDVRLDRADVGAGARGPPDGQGAGQGVGLDRVPHGGRGSVRLHVLEVAGGDARLRADPADEVDLRVGAGHGDAVGVAVLVDPAAEDHRVDPVPVPYGVLQPLQRDQADPFGPYVAVGGGVERTGAPAGRQEAALRLGHGVLRGHVQQRPAYQREVALTAVQRLAGEVDGDQGGAAGGVDGEAGAAEVEAVRDPVGDHRHHGPGRGVGGQRGEAQVGELQDLVVQGEGPDVDRDVAAC